MKKSLLLSLVAASAMSMAAQTPIVWDFYTHGIFAKYLDPNDQEYYKAKGEADIILPSLKDNEGNPLADSTKDPNNDADPYHNMHGIPNRLVSLFDQRTYSITPDADWKNGTLDNPCKFVPGEEIAPGEFTEDVIEPLGAEYAANLKNSPFICWMERKFNEVEGEPEYYCPARVHWYGDTRYGSVDAWADKDNNAVDEANWVSGLGALVLMKSKEGKKTTTGTYIQFPEVQGPFKATYWILCTTAARNYTVSSVVNGAVDEASAQHIEDNVTVKRYYKQEYSYTGNSKAALRIMTNGSELALFRVEITPSSESGIEDIIANPADENAPIYNVMGIQVDENYKGIVIKNGKKYIQK